MPETFGSYIRRIREARNLSLRQAAAIIPMNYTYLFAVEKGPEIPSGEKIQKMAKAYGISVSMLINLLPPQRQAETIASDAENWPLICNFYCIYITRDLKHQRKLVDIISKEWGPSNI